MLNFSVVLLLYYRNNPISTGGRIAEEFNVIARATWYGQYRSITPRDFKVMIPLVSV